jgi:hypothetical protein
MPKINTNVTVIKANGEKEKFNLEKVVTSLKRVGASNGEIKQVIEKLAPKLYENITTSEIYSIVFSELHTKDRTKRIANRYSLKKAIFDLGPTGYPFEQFIAGLLEEQGYTCQTNKIVSGGCVEHEMDIVATRGSDELLIEAKFHANQGYKTKIQTALYVWGRYLDISNAAQNTPKPWLITNTKITSQVKQYAKCVGMHVVSWNYPHGQSLRDMVDKSNLHPITCLKSLDNFTKENLLKAGAVFIKDLKDHEELFKNKEVHRKILQEAEQIKTRG